jgi:hypothetical protein
MRRKPDETLFCMLFKPSRHDIDRRFAHLDRSKEGVGGMEGLSCTTG